MLKKLGDEVITNGISLDKPNSKKLIGDLRCRSNSKVGPLLNSAGQSPTSKIITPKEFYISFDYPFSNHDVVLYRDADDGFNLKQLVKYISETYKEIYNSEPDPGKAKMKFVGKSYFTENRAESDGFFGNQQAFGR